MVYLYEACDQISYFCHQQLLRKMRRTISWTDGRTDGQTDRGKTVYPLPLQGVGVYLFWILHYHQRHNCIIILNKTIRYFIDVQKHAKFLGVISSHAQIPKPIFFPTCTLQREKGVISIHVQKILLLFSI